MQPKRKKVQLQILKCDRCELSGKPGIQPTPFRGPTPALIAVVGEAPGKEENRAGKPFVGPTGKFLSKYLAYAKIDEKKIFICNTVSCWPEGTPTTEHQVACRKNLRDQLRLADPRYVLLVGGVAYRTFKPDGRITFDRGRWWKEEKSHRIYFPVLHPSYIFRFLSEEKTFENDIMAFAALVRQRETLRASEQASKQGESSGLRPGRLKP